MIERPFTLTMADGEAIRGDLRLPDGEPPVSAVVVVHGFKGFKDWGFFPYVCETLAADGHAVVSFNFSLNGVGEDPLNFTRLDAFGRNTLSREVDETLRVLREVAGGDLLPVPPARVGVLGHSRGGGDAIVAVREAMLLGDDARDAPRVDALVTWAALAGFDRWDTDTREEWRREGRIHVMNARTGQRMPLDVTLLDDFEANRERLDVEAAARALGQLPWLLVHGEEDASVSVDDAHRLARANPEARVELVSGAGHTFEARHPFSGSTPELEVALNATRRHFRRHLNAEGLEAAGDEADRRV